MGDAVLALDDYHVITAPAIHNGLAWLLDYLPPTCIWSSFGYFLFVDLLVSRANRSLFSFEPKLVIFASHCFQSNGCKRCQSWASVLLADSVVVPLTDAGGIGL